jgi:type III restriction enzyme
MANKYKEMPCVGAYVDGLIAQFGAGNTKIVAGEDANYGSKKVAVFQTSDNRTRTHVDLGVATTWVKWATPSAEALRQACLAEETRLTHVSPKLPSSYISRMSVSNSRFLGPIDLELNQEYNAVIGGRGTGKSTILEYLRWALCDQVPEIAADEDISSQASRRERLVQATLGSIPGAVVEVHFVVNELPHVVRREAETRQINLKVGDQDFRQVSEADVRSVIPIQAYSQKQLSGVAVRVDELTRFVTAPVQARLTEIEAGLASTGAEIREAYARLQRQRQLQAAIRRDELALQSLGEQAAKLRDGLTGVSPEDQMLLDQRAGHEATRQFVESLERGAARSADESRQLTEFLQRVRTDVTEPPLGDIAHPEQVLRMQRALDSTLTEAIAAAESISTRLADLSHEGNDYSKARAELLAARAEFDQKYQAASRRWTEHEQRLNELSEVEERQRSLSDSLAMSRDELRDLGDPDKVYGELRKRWLALRDDHTTIVSKQCEDLTNLSEAVIRAALKAGSAIPELSEALRAAIARSGVRASRIDAFADALEQKADPLGMWEVILSELETLALYDSAEALAGAAPDTPGLLGLGFPAADVQRIAARLSTDAWLDLSLTRLADRPVFTYRSKEDHYIPFENASAGQQATALLHVLLSQHGPPLIIDQPEDDLDNEVVLAVAEQIWEAKSRRQLIFASHNANLVVNGDADLVVGCEYRVAGDHSGGRIAHQGAIDVREVREVITSVMEGGEKAFRLRTAKYGF